MEVPNLDDPKFSFPASYEQIAVLFLEVSGKYYFHCYPIAVKYYAYYSHTWWSLARFCEKIYFINQI